MIRARVYIALIRLSTVARTRLRYYYCALIMNVLKITLSIAGPPRPRPPFHLRPFLKDARGDNPPPTSRARFRPNTPLVIFTSLYLSSPRRGVRFASSPHHRLYD